MNALSQSAAWKIGAAVAGCLAACFGGCLLTTPLDSLSDGKRDGSPGGASSSTSGPGGASSSVGGGGCDSAYVASVLQTHPLAFYRLDDPTDVAADSGENGLNGIYGSEVARERPGLLPHGCGRGAVFPGKLVTPARSIQVPRNPKLEPTALTIEAWFKASSLPSGPNHNPAIVVYGNDGSNGAIYTMDIDSAGSNLELYLTVPGAMNGNLNVESKTVLKVDTVYYAVATYDGSTLSLYLDGLFDNRSSNGNKAPIGGYDGTTGLFLGADVPLAGRSAFDGTIQDVALYDTALSADDIAAHYNASAR
jgi:hypothetical protein